MTKKMNILLFYWFSNNTFNAKRIIIFNVSSNQSSMLNEFKLQYSAYTIILYSHED